jgi:hypothetical protein
MSMGNSMEQVIQLLLLRTWPIRSILIKLFNPMLKSLLKIGVSADVSNISTLICIPIGGELLPNIGAKGFVAFFSGTLVLSLASFLMARWAWLEYRWR